MAMRWRYYCTMRPFAPGSVPAGKEVVDWGDLDPTLPIAEIDHTAWSWIEYERKLTEKEISDYELAPADGHNRLALEHAIIERAEGMGFLRDDKITHMLDIENANKEFSLRLEEWLEADDFNFAHDWFGIREHIDRRTCKMSNCFVPRFAGYGA